jgi:hypothetical protein
MGEKMVIEGVRLVEVEPIDFVAIDRGEPAVIRIDRDHGRPTLSQPLGETKSERRLPRARPSRDPNEMRRFHGNAFYMQRDLW